MQLNIICQLMEKNGFQVLKAYNGFEAFELVKQSIQMEGNEIIDLIILDLQMPISNGYDACRKIENLFKKARSFVQTDTLSITISEEIKSDIVAHYPNRMYSNSNNGSSSLSGIQLNEKDLKPILVALTSHVNSEIANEC